MYKKKFTRKNYRRRPTPSVRKVARSVRFLKSVVNTERKFIDTGVLSSGVNNTGTVVYFSGVAQGTDQQTRIGNSIKAMQVYVRGSMVMSASATTTIVRMILIRDNNNQGTTPLVGDILATADVNAQLSQFNGKRFTILADRCYNLDINNRRVISYTIFRKLGFHIKYGGSSAAPSQQRDNGLFMLIISNEPTNLPSVTYNSRTRFIDN